MPRRLALGGLTALALLALAGCGKSRTESRRDAVNAYITRVNEAEQNLLGQVGEIDIALGRFSVAHPTPAETARLDQAQTAISGALRRVRALTPPPEARRLHAEVVALLSDEKAVADELVQASRYGPSFTAALLPLRSAASHLGRDLAAAGRSVKAAKPVATAPTGPQLWTAAGCGACHTLSAAGSNGTSGPDLDHVQPSSALIIAQVRSGGQGMPSYDRSFNGAELATLAAYVAAASRGKAPAASSTPASVATQNAAAYAAYGAAFARYRARLEQVAKTLSHLAAPHVLQPGLTAERRALARSLVLTAKIEIALARHRPAAANAAIKSLFGSVAGVSSAKLRREQNAATRAYNARVKGIQALSAKITTERQTLLTRLG